MERDRTNLQIEILIAERNIGGIRDLFETIEADRMVFDEIETLRSEIEPLDGWIRTKELARQELGQLPPDVFGQLSERFQPFIEAIPAGHGKGHLLRDMIHLNLILQDPKLSEADDAVELIAGAMAGVFHDIGNAVVERYQDKIRFAGHAEVGAYIFGEIVKDILPENILKLSQLAIAAHPHYPDVEIERDGQRATRRAYDDEIVDGHKIAMWLARQADRLDGQDITYIARHILVKHKPITHFSWEKGFESIWSDEDADFLHQFAVKRRSNEYLDSLPKDSPERKNNTLETIIEHRESVFDTELPYSEYDSQYFTWDLMNTKTLRETEFVRAVEQDPLFYTQEERNQIIDRFLKVCRILEPASDIDHVINVLREKFRGLPLVYQNHWAHGFELLTDTLYPAWYEETKEKLINKPEVPDPKLQEVVDELYSFSLKAIEMFSPQRLED